MAYSTASPPVLVSQGIGGGNQTWNYDTTDAPAVVDTANYFTNGGSLGMAVGGILFTKDTDASPKSAQIHIINATGDGTTDISDGVAITATDTD